jgi:DNA-binding SARP family transcriptional activator
MEKLNIRTFGGFDIVFEDKHLSNSPMRRGKIWMALKYLIAHHKRPVLAEELIEILWPDGNCSNPSVLLKNLIYRLRKILTHYYGNFQFIAYSQGQYSWNPAIEYIIDTVAFENLLAGAKDNGKDADERIKYYKNAIALYRGDFLRGESNDMWLVGYANYYRRLYLSAVDELADLYEQQTLFEEAINLCAEAIKIEPYEERLYVLQIRLLIYIGEHTLAKQQYQRIEKILKSEFDALPGTELLNLRLELGSTDGEQADLEEIKSGLDNNIIKKTAIYCGTETFKRIYCYDKHLDERMPFPVFLAMITVQINADTAENKENLRPVMKTLRQIILHNLRQCDVVCQCSANQFMLLLTATNENNKMAPLIRVQKLFEKEFPPSGVKLHTQAVAMGDKKILS